MKDGRVQLLQTTSQAATVEDARDGMLFMQEMIQLSKNAPVPDEPQSRIVRYAEDEEEVKQNRYPSPDESTTNVIELNAGPAQFGYDLATRPPIKAPIVIIKPFNGCGNVENSGQCCKTVFVFQSIYACSFFESQE